MSEKTIDSLPEEVLVEVFKLLDLKTLKKVVLTCKKWQVIAEQSVPWSLQLFYDDNQAEFLEERTESMLTSSRRYTTVIIRNLLDLNSSRKMDVFENIGSNIATLKLYCCNLEDLPLLIDFFNLMKNLKKLILHKTTCKDMAAFKTSDLPSFPKLRKLEMIQSEYTIFEFFKAAQLTSLKVLNDPRRSDAFQSSSEPLKNLLATQKNLKTLALRAFRHNTSKLFETPIEDCNIPFKLTELSLVNIKLKESPNEYNNFLKFMHLHSKTVEKLELSSRLPDFVFEFAFAKFKSLKTLRLKADSIPTDLAFFDRLEDNESLTTLILVGEADSSISQLFTHLPNIEHVELPEDCDFVTLKSIAENLKKLKHLKVKCFNGSLFRNLNFPTLKALSIESVEGIEWDLFAGEAPGITHLFINWLNWINILEDMNIKKIMRGFKIQSLTINCEIFADEAFFDVIRAHGSSLTSLNLSSRSLYTGGQSTEVPDIRGLCLREFPVEDPLSTGNGAWDEKSYGGNFPYDDDNSDDHDEFEEEEQIF